MSGGSLAAPDRSRPAASNRRRVGAALRVSLGLAILLAALTLPARPTLDGLWRLPLEWLWALGVLALARGRLFALAATLALAAAAGTALLKLADWGTILAFSRPFDPVIDANVLVAGWHLLSGSVGRGQAAVVLVAAVGAFLALVALAAWGLTGIRRLPPAGRRVLAVAGLAGGVAALLPPVGAGLPVSMDLPAYVATKGETIRRSVAARAEFERELAHDPLAETPPANLLSALAGRDVLVLFVESYGRSAIEDPLYAGRTGARLRAVERELAESSIAARSGWMASPIAGGQSWLAHGTLLSGLRVDNQTRYATLLRSDRPSLNRLFGEAGWRTVAVMPAITMPWPEAAWFGYDEVLAARDLGYRGLPFDWVTMPDQFTLSRIGAVLREASEPVMLQAALISSHAPWTPLSRMVPWEEVGDGSVFDAQARGGEAPASLWRDPARVRENYGVSIDYALEAVGAFAARFAPGAVVVVLGDHQPAELLTGPGASRDVPFHVLSSDPAVLGRLAGWDLTEGMVPAPGAPSFPMSEFRERFARAMSGEEGR